MATMSLDAAAAAMRDEMRDTVRRNSLLYLLQGILMVVTGLLALIYPSLASVAIVRLLGWLLIISGILQGFGLIGAGEVPYFWMQLLSAVLAILIGVLLLRHTDAGLLLFSVLFLIYFMIEGMVKTIFAFIIRPFPNWGWVLASGLLGIVIALYLWANLSTVSDWMLGVLLGVFLLVEGTALSSLAWRVRQAI